ncbi:DNA replication/checkpoint protein [Xylariaceae sp. FL0016]|nr:DNA replication/checkpoint protein [Xylariaceae sp. FL0016]
MDDLEKQQYEAASAQLRADLKRFEADWAKLNGGKKPGRSDIKQNAEIAQKYKKYNQVRDLLAGKVPPRKDSSMLQKRKSDEAHAQTPSKRSRPAETPSKVKHFSVGEMTFETPSGRKLFSPAVPTSIGPTPQRDGKVLGLFDLLVEHDESTPSKDGRTVVLLDSLGTQATPSKKLPGDNDDSNLGRTPTSASKRARLDNFMTPRRRNDSNVLGARTPNYVSKLQLSTPSFLRRAPVPLLDENGEYVSPSKPLRLPRKPLGRGLSSVVAGLRKLEEKELDDDLEALREIENDDGASRPVRPATEAIPKPDQGILEPDSQVQQLLGGFDDEARYDSPTEDGLVPGGQPSRAYKKKGQKRTTRKVNMRPTRSKRPQQLTSEGFEFGDDNDNHAALEMQSEATRRDVECLEPLSDSDFEASTNKEHGRTSKPMKPVSRDKEEGPIKKAAKKVNELAHANFKRLKLRNNGSKGGPAFGSRFRRRR